MDTKKDIRLVETETKPVEIKKKKPLNLSEFPEDESDNVCISCS